MRKNQKITPKFITIEKIDNGFVLTYPDIDSSVKYFKKTLNGVITFFKTTWEVSEISTAESTELTTDTSETILMRIDDTKIKKKSKK